MTESDAANTPAIAPPAPPTTGPSKPVPRLSTRATVRRCILWIVIAYVAGTASFILGWVGQQASPAAMILGIGLYGGCIGVVSSSGRFRRRLQRPFIARSLKVGYGIRLATCIIPGAAMTVDMFPGIIAVMVGDVLAKGYGLGNFTTTLASTLVQGTLINIATLAIVLLAWLFQKMFMEWKPPIRDTRDCAGCGYHLETLEADTTSICPECGQTNQGLNDRRPWIDRTSWSKFLLVVIPAGIVGILAQGGTLLLIG